MTTGIAELTAAIEERLTKDWGHASGLAYACRLPDKKPDFTLCGGPAAEAYWEHFTPYRQMDRVKATRSLVAAILARPHVLDDSEWYGCQAVTHSYSAADGSPFPDRDGRYVPTGRECTCGRDEDVARLLGIIASEWEDT